jgi:hypothetical protein
MNQTKPYGNPKIADLLVIGHDPRLQESDTEAEYVFFLDYLERELPKQKPELRKYGLAKAVIDYIAHLTNNRYTMDKVNKLYVTNLCNQFLPHPAKKGQTVLIPDDEADRGINDIEKTLESGPFKLILPMSLQVFYQLARRGFIPNETSDIVEFLSKAQPDKSHAGEGAYVPIEEMPFVNVCGNVYYCRDRVPVIPILHVKTWQRMVRNEPYRSRMTRAVNNVCRVLSDQ